MIHMLGEMQAGGNDTVRTGSVRWASMAWSTLAFGGIAASRVRRRSLQGDLQRRNGTGASSSFRAWTTKIAKRSARDNRLPAVDATVAGRRGWNTGTTCSSSSTAIPAGELSAREQGQPRGLPPADREPRRRHPLSRLRDAVQQRFAVLVRSRLHGATGRSRTRRRRATYIARLDDVPRYFDEEIANMRAGLKRGFTRAARGARRARCVDLRPSPKPRRRGQRLLQAVQDSCRRTFPPTSRRGCAPTACSAIHDRVIPAYAKLLKFFRDEYRAARAQDARRRSAARRQGVLSAADHANTRRSISTPKRSTRSA